MNEKSEEPDVDRRIANRLAREHQQLIDSECADKLVEQHDDELQPAREMLNLIDRVRRGEPGVDSETPVRQIETLVDVVETTSGPTISFEQDFCEQNRLGDFELIRLLGKGGYGLVFLAKDTRIDRLVALKVPRPESLLNPEYQKRMLREAKAAAALSHPNIIPVYEAGKIGAVWYIASQYVEGFSLSKWIEEQTKPIPLQLAAKIVSILADAIQHAHSRDVLHRDLKPGNVLIDCDPTNLAGFTAESADEMLRIADFGLARIRSDDSSLTSENAIVGTPAYMSPEQAAGDNQTVESATDVYSLGAILFTLLTGKPPFLAKSILETIQKVRNDEPVSVRHMRADVPRDLEAVCHKCLEKSPQKRYSTAWELYSDLQRYLSGRPVVARKITPILRVTKWVNRNRTISAMMTTILATLIAVTALWFSAEGSRKMAERERDRANLKASQLTNAINRLFTVVAESPTIQLEQAAPLRHELLQQANELFEELAAEDSADGSVRAERAKSVFRLAKLNWLLGNLNRSVELARIAADETRFLMERNLVAVDELAFWNAYYAQRLGDQGNHQAALKQFERGFQLLGVDELTTGDGFDTIEDVDLQASFLRALSMQIRVLIDAGEFSQADQLTSHVVELCNRLPDEILDNTNARQAKASCLIRQGTVYNEKRQFDKSQVAFQEAIGLLEPDVKKQLIELPELIQQYAHCHRQLGIALAQNNQFEEARGFYAIAVEHFDHLASNHPRVKDYKLSAGSVRYSMAVSELLTKNLAEAESLTLKNIEQFTEMRMNFPDLEATLVDKLARNYNLLFAVRQRSPEHSIESAKEAIGESIKYFRLALEHATHPDRLNIEMCRAISNLAYLHILEKKPAQAREQLEIANQILANILKRHPDWNEVRDALAGNHGNVMNSFIEEKDFENALAHCQLSLGYDSGRNKKVHHQHLVAEGELMIKAGAVRDGIQKLASYIENVATDPGHFVFAAHRIMKLHDDEEFSDVVKDFSFDQLAVFALKQGMPESDGQNQERFFASIDEYENLASIRNRIKKD